MPATLDSILSTVTNPSRRLFGVEIECIGMNPSEASDLLHRNGISVRAEAYNHSRRNHWKITTDSSISDAHSCEVVSPPLEFTEENLRLVAKVVKLLKDAGCRVDDSCGLHVHVDARDVQNFPTFSRVLFLRYRESEDQIDGIVEPNRRGNGNRYCRSLTRLERGSNFDTINADRYQKLNFQSFQRHGTVEFRQHHGTLDNTRVVAWVIFCMNFFEQSYSYFQTTGQSEILNAHRWTTA